MRGAKPQIPKLDDRTSTRFRRAPRSDSRLRENMVIVTVAGATLDGSSPCFLVEIVNLFSLSGATTQNTKPRSGPKRINLVFFLLVPSLTSYVSIRIWIFGICMQPLTAKYEQHSVSS